MVRNEEPTQVLRCHTKADPALHNKLNFTNIQATPDTKSRCEGAVLMVAVIINTKGFALHTHNKIIHQSSVEHMFTHTIACI